jgi:hypothetical protein
MHMLSGFGRLAIFFVLISSFGLPVQAALDFNSGTFGGGLGMNTFGLIPTGGTPPYTFSYAPGATPIPYFRVVNSPELPSNAGTGATGALVGLPLEGGSYPTTIRLTDGTSAFVDKAVTVAVTAMNFAGIVPQNYGVGDTVSVKFWGIGETGVYEYSLDSGTLPPGLSLNPSTGEVSGTIGSPAGTYTFWLKVKVVGGGNDYTSKRYSMFVSPLQLTNFQNRILPNGTQNQSYSQTLVMTGGTGPYTFTRDSGSLPNGLSLSSSGVLSGTPTGTAFNTSFRVNVADSASPTRNQVKLYFNISVLPQTPQPLWIANAVLTDAPVGASNTISIGATGGLPPYTFTLDPGSTLPQGMVVLNAPALGSDFYPGPGYLCGIVLTPGVYSLTLRVTDNAGNTATRPYTWRVSPIGFLQGSVPASGISTPVLGSPYSQYLIPVGGTPPYTITSINIPAGMSVNNAGLLSGTPAESGSSRPFSLGLADTGGAQFTSYGTMNINSGTSASLTLNGGDLGVAQLGSYSFTVNASGSPLGTPNYSVSLVGGSLPPGLELLTGKDFENFTNNNNAAMLGGVLGAPGTYKFTLRVTDGAGNVGQREYRLRVSSLNIMLGSALPPATVNVPYSQTLEPRGGTPPYTFSVTNGSLPTGLNLDPSTGVISGTPLTTSAFSVGIGLADSSGDYVTRSFTFNIYSLRITNPEVIPVVATNGVPFSYTFVVDPPGVYQWSYSGPLPDGLTLNPNTGELSGIPADDPDQYNFAVTASNASTSVTKNFALFGRMPEVAGLLLDLPTDSLDDAQAGSRFVYGLEVHGGTPPYTITALSALPPGLALVPGTMYAPVDGVGYTTLAGIPTTPGNYSFRLRYTDSASPAISVERTVRLNITTLGLATFQLGAATYNTPYSAQFKGVGGSGPYTFALVDRPGVPLPCGLALDSDGTLHGTPTSTGYCAFGLTLSSGGASREFLVVLQIYATGTRRIDMGFRGFPGADVSVGRRASAEVNAYGGGGTHTWSIVSGSLPPGMQLLSGSSLPPNSTSPPNAILAGAPSAPGTYRFALRVDDSTGNFGVTDKTLVVSPLRVGPINYEPELATVLPPARVGTAYSFAMTSLTGRAPFTFTALPGTYLPAGMSLSPSGVLAGTPADGGNFILNLLITDADGKTLRISNADEVGLYVAAAGAQMGPLIADGPGRAPVATVGTPFTFWPLDDLLYPGSGTPPFHWTVPNGSLPPGLSIIPGSGSTSDQITGTPTTAGSFAFSLMVTDANGKQSGQSYAQIDVSVMGISPGMGYLPPATAGTPYSKELTASGCSGACPFRLAWFSDLPPGLSLSSSGLLSGTPTTNGPFDIYVQTVDAASNLFTQWYVLDVAPAGAPSPALQVTPTSISLNYVAGSPSPSPIPLNIASTGAAINYGVFSSDSWLSVSAASGTTPGTVNAIITPGAVGPGTYTGTVTVTSAEASNAPVTVPITFTVSAPVACSYALGSSETSILAAGGAGSFAVNTAATCNWTAATAYGWITVGSPGSGTGSGTVNFTVLPNGTGATRIGTIAVQGLLYTVTQFGPSCSFTIFPTSATVSSGGSTGGVTVSASAGSCGWSTSSVPGSEWVSVSGGGSGTGSGSVNIAAEANASTASRIGTITVAGQTFTVNQAGRNCSYSLTSAGASISSVGGAAAVGVLAPPGCAWTVDPGPGWISLTSGGSGSGNSTVPVSLSVQANSSTAARSTGVLVAGQTFLVTQDGVPCSFSLSAVNPMQPAPGGGGSVAITAAGGGCGWVASSNADWLHLSAASGTGTGSITFTVDTNPGAASRSATLTVAGQNIVVSQAGTTCSFSLRSPSAVMPAAAGASSVGLTTAAGCNWAAASNAPSWLHITGGAGPSGPQEVAFSVDANPGPADRSGTLTIAGQNFGVTQAAPACIITLAPPSTYSAGETGGSTAFTYTTSVSGCPHTVQSYASWIHVNTATYGGTDGSVAISVDANTYAAVRNGVVKVGDRDYTVSQAASTCAYTLTSFGATFYQPGGNGFVPVTFTPPICGPPPVLVNAPLGMITLGSVGSGTGTYTQDYAVSLYQSFINYVRTAQLIVSGQIYTVKQNSWNH